jgi:outer membrane protein TolC
LEDRSDIAAARTRLELATRALTQIDLELLPNLSLQTRIHWQSRVVYGPHSEWDVRGVLSVPIWDGGERYGQRRRLVAEYNEARQALAAARLAAVVDTRRYRRAVEVNAALRDLARERRDLAIRIDERTRAGYARGAGTSLELVSAAQVRREAELDLTLRDYQLMQARVLAILSNAYCTY